MTTVFNEHVLIACYVPDIVLGVRNIEVLALKESAFKEPSIHMPHRGKHSRTYFNQITAVTIKSP